ncbi:amino acid ABC transporter substrate-binding protein [Alteromonas sp. BL110]|uniref:amino acid ABC transporter substrate-binding protein n=1 Tax=Alteromonas sp. BL110 TaxID=1714845 RepID=UPI000E48004D|nr:amino acid ABC transporter substrate-binding protein [Alteromonas sp. BL110]AXT39057.1 amino acid ABC transporter substrate-binding protein [Alteromonas sp. BL110]RKM85287.1 amino acid ABC transporter substrate-binding protein [Alteromonas sp. BL110]
MDIKAKSLSRIILLMSLLTHFVVHGQQPPSDEVSADLPHTVLRLPNVHPGRDSVYSYAKTLLTEALRITQSQYGTFELIVSDQETAQERQLRSLEHNMLDVTWSVTSTERERQFIPIRIPIMAGLFGKRALFVKEGDVRLKEVKNLVTLQQFRAVLGYDWPDTKIFRANDIPVLETTYRASFRIVSEGFADMFPRSVMEINEEFADKNLSKGLTIDDNLIISYPSPIFFFVGSDNQALAGRIAEGLLMLFETGKFQELLLAHKNFKEGMTLTEGRTIIEIDNPLLSEQSRLALEKFLPEFAMSEAVLKYDATEPAAPAQAAKQ